MADYFLVEFSGKISCRIYGTTDKSEAISMAEALVQKADGCLDVMLDIEDLDAVERMEED